MGLSRLVRFIFPRLHVTILLPPCPPQDLLDGGQPMIQILKGRTEREPDKVMAVRVEEVSTASRVDVEEDPRDHDRLFFEELFEKGLKRGRERERGFSRGSKMTSELTYETVAVGCREGIQVQPDVERARRWDLHFQLHLLESPKDVISFGLEVSLEGELQKADGDGVLQTRRNSLPSP